MSEDPFSADDWRDHQAEPLRLEPVGQALPPYQFSLREAFVITSIAGLGFCLLTGLGISPTMGSTRSARLEWEQRQVEMEQALLEAQTLAQPTAAIDGDSDS